MTAVRPSGPAAADECRIVVVGIEIEDPEAIDQVAILPTYAKIAAEIEPAPN